MTHANYILPIITSAIIGVSVYALTPPTPTLQEQAEQESQRKLSTCLSEIPKESNFTERQKLLRKCVEIKPIILLNVEESNTGTASLAPVSEEPKQVDNTKTLRAHLGIPTDCEVRELNFNTKHKLPKYNLEWLAYDIPPCHKGESIEVKSPPGIWNIEKVGYGTNLGNFVILKSSIKNFRIILGHTESMIEEGSVVTEGTFIGRTDISGASSGMHLHVELWEGEDIVSREYLWQDEGYTREYKKDLLTHRGWDFSK